MCGVVCVFCSGCTAIAEMQRKISHTGRLFWDLKHVIEIKKNIFQAMYILVAPPSQRCTYRQLLTNVFQLIKNVVGYIGRTPSSRLRPPQAPPLRTPMKTSLSLIPLTERRRNHTLKRIRILCLLMIRRTRVPGTLHLFVKFNKSWIFWGLCWPDAPPTRFQSLHHTTTSILSTSSARSTSSIKIVNSTSNTSLSFEERKKGVFVCFNLFPVCCEVALKRERERGTMHAPTSHHLNAWLTHG